MVGNGNEMDVPIYQEKVALCSAQINFSNGGLIFGKTADKLLHSIYSKNPRRYSDIISIIHNKNMKFEILIRAEH